MCVPGDRGQRERKYKIWRGYSVMNFSKEHRKREHEWRKMNAIRQQKPAVYRLAAVIIMVVGKKDDEQSQSI
jgi:hypothetical protein